MRLFDLEMIKDRDRVAHDMLETVGGRICRYVGRLVAARRVGDAAVAFAKFTQLRLPAAVIARKFMHKQNNRASLCRV
jgi:hypothetical protein